MVIIIVITVVPAAVVGLFPGSVAFLVEKEWEGDKCLRFGS